MDNSTEDTIKYLKLIQSEFFPDSNSWKFYEDKINILKGVGNFNKRLECDHDWKMSADSFDLDCYCSKCGEKN